MPWNIFGTEWDFKKQNKTQKSYEFQDLSSALPQVHSIPGDITEWEYLGSKT